MDYFGFFSGFEGGFGYVVVFVALLACGLGLPIPEDIILISGGYIAADAGHSVWPMVIVGLLGILAGDSLTFMAGRRFGLPLAARKPLNAVLTPARLLYVDGLFKKHGERILVAARFMPGVRAVAYFSAGAMGVPYWKFVVFDGLAALVSAPLWVVLGFRYGATVVGWAKQFGWFLLVVGLIALLIWLLRRRNAPPQPLLRIEPDGHVVEVTLPPPTPPKVESGTEPKAS